MSIEEKQGIAYGVKSGMAYEILVGASLDSAHKAAVHDYEWSPLRHDKWIKPDGTLVVYAQDVDSLAGYRHGSVIHIGPRFWLNSQSDDIEKVIESRGFLVVTHTQNMVKTAEIRAKKRENAV